jgi:hypothetical protein
VPLFLYHFPDDERNHIMKWLVCNPTDALRALSGMKEDHFDAKATLLLGQRSAAVLFPDEAALYWFLDHYPRGRTMSRAPGLLPDELSQQLTTTQSRGLGAQAEVLTSRSPSSDF